MRDLQGKTALITGAARGQGRAHAVALAKEGVNIVCCDLHEEISPVPYKLAVASDLERRTVEEGGRQRREGIVRHRVVRCNRGGAASEVGVCGTMTSGSGNE